jgi:CRISPR-associated protein Csb1
VVSGFVEATNVAPVAYGGVKNDHVMPSPGNAGVKVKATDGYGNVPYHREDFAAERITAYFNVDLTLLRSYGLGDDAERLLFTLAQWKIRRFLDEGLRLRTACDLAVDDDSALSDLPTATALEEVLPGLIEACSDQFASPRVTVLQRGK